MRLATILACVLLPLTALFPLTALSQPCDPAETTEVCPDTTDAQRYFPLALGTSWQYREAFGGEVFHWSRRIVGEEEVDGRTYFLLETCDERGDGGAECAEPLLLRYDEEHAMIVRRDGEEEAWWQEVPCRLDVAFNLTEEEGWYACSGPGTEDALFLPAQGAYGATIAIPPNETSGDTRKHFDTPTFSSTTVYAGLGPVEYDDEFHPEPTRLVYAFISHPRTGGRQLGVPAFAACHPGGDIPCPDTTDWRRYYPLEVGNEWQYEFSGPCGYSGFSCWKGHQIVGTEEIDGATYYLERHCRSDPYSNDPEEIRCGSPRPLRYDDEARTVVGIAPDGAPYDALGVCRLGLPFNFFAHEPECGLGGVGELIEVEGRYGHPFDLGTGPQLSDSRKTFSSLGGGTAYFAGIGYTLEQGDGSAYNWGIAYARVGGVTYGTSLFAFPTSSEPEATAPAASHLGPVHPNPARSALTVAYELAAPQEVALEVVDVLGRRVRTLELGARPAGPGEARLEAGGLAAGLYVVRLLGGGEALGARRVTVLP